MGAKNKQKAMAKSIVQIVNVGQLRLKREGGGREWAGGGGMQMMKHSAIVSPKANAVGNPCLVTVALRAGNGLSRLI